MNPRVVKNLTHPIKGWIFTCQMMRNLTKLGQPFENIGKLCMQELIFLDW